MRQEVQIHLPPSVLLYVFVCAVVPFAGGLTAGFVNWDDTFLILENPAVRTLAWSSVGSWFASFTVGHYHPLVLFTFAVEHALAGLEPFVFHATNVLLHGLNALLLLLLVRANVRDRLAIGLAVLFFAMHPLRAEAVVWVSARKDLLSTFFILSSVLLFMRYRAAHDTRLLAFSFGAAVLASLSKAIAIVIPLLLLCVVLTDHHRRRKDELRVLMPFVILAVITGVVAISAQYASGEAPFDPEHSFLRAVTLPFWNIVFYAWKTILPVGLSAVYPYPENGGPDLLGPSLISLVALSVATIVLIIKRPDRTVLFGVAWILVALAPVLQWIPVGRAFAADRYTYLPAAGLAVVMGVLLDRLLEARKGAYRPLVRRAGIIVLAVLGTVTYVRTDVWQRSVSLWTSVLEQYPAYAEGYVYLGSALATEEKNIPLAIEAFTESIRLDDRNPAAFRNRAVASNESGSPDTSQIISDLTTAITLAPENLTTQVLLAEAYLTYGMVQRSFDVCSALLDAYPTLHPARLLRIRSAAELGHDNVVEEDIRVLGEAGIEVTIERGIPDG